MYFCLEGHFGDSCMQCIMCTVYSCPTNSERYPRCIEDLFGRARTSLRVCYRIGIEATKKDEMNLYSRKKVVKDSCITLNGKIFCRIIVEGNLYALRLHIYQWE